jgi:hypothetical protein
VLRGETLVAPFRRRVSALLKIEVRPQRLGFEAVAHRRKSVEVAPRVRQAVQLEGEARLEETKIAGLGDLPNGGVDQRIRGFKCVKISRKHRALVVGVDVARRLFAVDRRNERALPHSLIFSSRRASI